MPKTTSPRLDPDALAELLERTRQDVKRYRLLHPEWGRAADDPIPSPQSAPSPTPPKPLP